MSGNLGPHIIPSGVSVKEIGEKLVKEYGPGSDTGFTAAMVSYIVEQLQEEPRSGEELFDMMKPVLDGGKLLGATLGLLFSLVAHYDKELNDAKES